LLGGDSGGVGSEMRLGVVPWLDRRCWSRQRCGKRHPRSRPCREIHWLRHYLYLFSIT